MCICLCVFVSYEFEFLLADCCVLCAVAVCYMIHVGEDVFTTRVCACGCMFRNVPQSV